MSRGIFYGIDLTLVLKRMSLLPALADTRMSGDTALYALTSVPVRKNLQNDLCESAITPERYAKTNTSVPR